MKLTKLVVIAIISSALGAGAVSAQTRPGSEPFEFPPASYLGKQYVDSKGCVFIRAGIDGTVSWVPRVTRSRTGVCGFKPTFAGQVTPPTPVQTAAAAPVTIAPPVAVAPRPRPALAVQAAPKPKPAPEVVRQVAKQPAPAAMTPQRSAACSGVSAISSQYLRTGNYTVRCGPQNTSISGSANSVVAAPHGDYTSLPFQVSPQTRIVPRHVAANRINTTNVQVPNGYKRVWTDGRLNPKRAEQSLSGFNAMNLIWTPTVPRRLINGADGADVTASVALIYPYTDFAAQQRELGEVTIIQRDGQTVKRLVRSEGSTGAVVPRQTVYSSRSTPMAVPNAKQKNATERGQPKAEVAGRGFVQVGAFDDTANAHHLANKVQRMGLPVRVGRYSRDGHTTRLVIAGPFGGSGDVDRAISRLRSAGYDAFAR